MIAEAWQIVGTQLQEPELQGATRGPGGKGHARNAHASGRTRHGHAHGAQNARTHSSERTRKSTGTTRGHTQAHANAQNAQARET